MPWERARELLEGFDRGHQEELLRIAGAGLDADAVLDVAEAGKVAAALLGKYQTVTALIGDITAANFGGGPAIDAHLKDFGRLLEVDYHQLALDDDYPAEAEAFADLGAVRDRMHEIRLAPRIANRNLCAVAGGFSSGKSSFLNALIGGAEVLLPTRITPTTFLPTFIFNIKSAGQSIKVFNHHGGDIQVEPEMLQHLTHDFKQEYGIELKYLVNRISINTPRLKAYPNVALVDTPGYTDPDEGDGATSDEEISLRAVWQSRFLTWLVDCEKGTLPEQDVGIIKKFLQQQAEASASNSIYLILNKADKKPEDQRANILAHVAETAQKHEIPFFGIALYSCHSNEWYGCEGKSFDEFLKVINDAESLTMDALEDKVEAVFSQYEKYYRKELKEDEGTLGLMNRLSLILDDDQENLEDSLASHQRRLKKTIEDRKRWMEKAAVLQGKFRRSLRGFIEGVEAMRDE